MPETKRPVRAKTVTPTVLPPRSAYYTFWITRDRDPQGKLAEVVCVWYSRPYRIDPPASLARVWRTADMNDLYCTWSLAQAHSIIHVAPDDDRQCIRVGPEEDSRAVLELKVS